MEYIKLEAFTREHISDLLSPLRYSHFRVLLSPLHYSHFIELFSHSIIHIYRAIFTLHDSHLDSCYPMAAFTFSEAN